tara:strand:- start:927 stop:1073 length:147 start_codon:yes stop_codon:yes gene_type:complete
MINNSSFILVNQYLLDEFGVDSALRRNMAYQKPIKSNLVIKYKIKVYG